MSFRSACARDGPPAGLHPQLNSTQLNSIQLILTSTLHFRIPHCCKEGKKCRAQLLAAHPVSKDVEDVQLLDPPIMAASDSDLARVEDAFCRWEWGTPEVAFSWRPRQLAASPPPKWKHGLPPWAATVQFCQGLRWMTSDDSLTSSYELPWLWWHRCKWHPPLLHGDKEAGRFSSLLTW